MKKTQQCDRECWGNVEGNDEAFKERKGFRDVSLGELRRVKRSGIVVLGGVGGGWGV